MLELFVIFLYMNFMLLLLLIIMIYYTPISNETIYYTLYNRTIRNKLPRTAHIWYTTVPKFGHHEPIFVALFEITFQAIE